MWMMMDSNNVDHGREFKLPGADPVIGRKLRPLMPRPLSSSSTPYSTPSCCCIRNPNILSWNHAAISEDGVKREVEMAVVSTRWNPTPEQLQALEEMYRRGIRTPSAEQIQQIATKLGRFGKIEGKNVFYWFQNHKARERQKKRRQQQLELIAKQTPPPPPPAAASSASASGVSRRYLEIEHQKVSRTASEDSASMHGAVIAAGKDGWHHKELQQSATAENEIRCSWQLDLDLSSNSNSNSNSNSDKRLGLGLGQENTKPYLPSNLFNMNMNINIFNINIDNEEEEDPTLELFPTPTSTTPPPPAPQQQQHIPPPPHFTKITPPHFIEFLPIVKK